MLLLLLVLMAMVGKGRCDSCYKLTRYIVLSARLQTTVILRVIMLLEVFGYFQ